MVDDTTCRPDKAQDGASDRAYFTIWLTKLEELLDERHTTQRDALAIALNGMDKRLDGMNEFRATLRDREALSVTKAEFVLALKPLQDDNRELRDWKSSMTGKADQTALTRTTVVALVGVVSGVVGIASGVVAVVVALVALLSK
jgi:hypothetical protein